MIEPVLGILLEFVIYNVFRVISVSDKDDVDARAFGSGIQCYGLAVGIV